MAKLNLMCSKMDKGTASLLYALLLTTANPQASADWTEETSAVELRGQLQIGTFAAFHRGTMTSEPVPNRLLSQRTRLMVTAEPAKQWSAELHAVINLASTGITNGKNPGTERSAALDWRSRHYRTAVRLDRLNLQYQSQRLRIKAGRMPVNLSRSSYFAPLDWFAPFSAETFYRVYKPGVDALRLDLTTSGLSHLSLLQVQGYQPDPNRANGWSSHADPQQRSTIMQLSLTQSDFQWDVLAARIRGQTRLGLALQGELWQWLGLRAEGYRATVPDTPFPSTDFPNTNFKELTLELEHRWANSLTLHLATFWHGAGADSVVDYPGVLVQAQTHSPYLASRYQLLAADFDFTALLSTSAVWLRNAIDHSRLLALYARYSTGDESELTLGFTLPVGTRSPASEFDQYPRVLNLQFRYYF